MMLADIWRSVNDDCVRVEQYLHSAEQVAGNIGNDPVSLILLNQRVAFVR